MKVAKFGGSSVANVAQIKKVSKIIDSDPKRKFIVVSAPGKRNEEDTKVTDLLLHLGKTYINNKSFEYDLHMIIDRFNEIITGLNISSSILTEIKKSIQSILNSGVSTNLKIESLKSIGENSSAKILSAYLNTIGIQATYVNPKDAGIIVSNEPGNAQILQESFSKIYSLRDHNGVLVIPGFFGYTIEGNLITF